MATSRTVGRIPVVARDGIEPPAPGSIFGPHVDSGDFTLLTYVQNVRTMEPWASSGTKGEQSWSQLSQARRPHAEAIPVFERSVRHHDRGRRIRPERAAIRHARRRLGRPFARGRPIHGAAKTFGSFPLSSRADPRARRSTRQNDERPIRFQQRQAGRVLPPEPEPEGKTRITIRLDQDIVDRFLRMAEESGGAAGYQTLINAALREYLDGKTPSSRMRCGASSVRS